MRYLCVLFLLLGCAAAQDRLPDAPSKVVDKKFVVLSVLGKSAMTADLISTRLFLDAHAAREMNPLLGSNPSTQRLLVTGIAVDSGLDLGTYWLKKHHSRVWWLPRVVQISFNTAFAIKNFGIDRTQYSCTDYSDGRPRVCVVRH